MFSVPGWSVDSTSIAQEKPTAKSDGQPFSDTPSAASRKRKSAHSHNHPAPKVSGSELERLWNLQASAKHAKPEQSPRHGHDGRKPGKNKDSRQVTEQRKTGVGDVVAPKRKIRKQDEQDKQAQTSNVPEQPMQRKQERTRKEKRTSLNDGDTEYTSFLPDKILKTLPPAPPPATKLTPLQAKMRSKLTSARFRHLNETLYTTSSSAALDLFTSSPDLFAEYHAGFSQQVKDSWPVNPVENYIAAV